MSYKIIEVHQVYKDGKLNEIAVLWEANEAGWVRATYANTTPCNGYKFLLPNESLSESLLQEIAGYGMRLSDAKKKKYFSGVRKWD